jgi:uncharacterized protein (TIGR03435 family)
MRHCGFCVALAVVVRVCTPAVSAQSAVAAPTFEVAAIKLCNSGEVRKSANKAGPGRSGANSSPDRLSINCQTVRNFVRTAYVLDGRFNPFLDIPIEGGPAWIDSERYQIVAKAEGTPGQETMSGAMLRALLEDRFKMKVHRETREVPVYALTVAKGGPKLQRAQEGSCATLDLSNGPAAPDPSKKPLIFCAAAHGGRSGPNFKLEVLGATLDQFSRAIGATWVGLDRIVINKTGIKGTFDFHMEFAPGDETPELKTWLAAGPQTDGSPTSSDPSGGPSIFTAIQKQLGLKLESAKGPREFIVIDRVERPPEN